MMRRVFQYLFLALPLTLALACGGSGAAPGRSMDVEGGDEGGARRVRREAPKALSADQIPLLSLDGVTVPVPAVQAQEGAEPGEVKPGAPKAGGPVAGAAKAGAPKAGGAKPGTAAADEDDGEEGPAVVQSAPAKPLSGRNLFAFEEDPAVVAQRRQQQEEAAKKAEEMAKKSLEARKQQEDYVRQHPPPPQPPAIPFTFVGYMGPPEHRIGVFSSGGQGVFLAKVGDTVQEKFRIVDIGYESAEVGFQGFKDTKRIPLQGGGK